MNTTERIKLGISIGDVNGIGGEVILRTFEDPRMLEFCTPVIFAGNKVMAFQKKHFDIDINYNGVQEVSQVVEGKINIVNISKNTPKIEFGQETEEAGKYAVLSLKCAVEALKAGEVDVLVTAPVNKSNIQSEEFRFPGHTDYLARELGGEALMFMVTDDLKVGLLTDHIAINEVSRNITPELVREKVEKVHDSLVRDFRVRKPRIALLGINPHSGDNGVIGQEDDQVLKPVIAELFEKGIMVFGPYSADSFFGSGNYRKFDAVLAAYHDQGLIPFKTLSFGRGVNYTAGLEKVRTSPDHGTAYGIAGKGEADFRSFEEAVFTAIQIYRNRREYDEISANPLKRNLARDIGHDKRRRG
ncbi:4-hydroxythreonine-4-phosphate dehydrogenase PdxA [Sinomicrobium soli]|uniref:4-hydroxythreonine-4-phosphate dehydrogenase PdxA n=1 Tax=Sinomicrobium sp. N-1-3-6 TaxID=2219864 RepID=UPI000DCC0A9F|nr:4-hydroxythreonine-4-phosphate dehydrogenase PdxA [Sinomicrobium sp. N-1-3-6]RAV28359.1 4-hydroxythreonine-4-phosphate dehydrogenase PdxA [Sinomicrobium sp. N-1-3-6]